MAMRRNRRELLAIAWVAGATAALLAVFVVLVSGLIWSTLDLAEREALRAALLPRWPLLLLGIAAGAAAVAAGVPSLFERWIVAPARLLEHVRILLSTNSRPSWPASAPAGLSELAASVDQLATQRDQLKSEMTRQVLAASFGIEQERNRLAVLMGELQQSVVVCNLDGRILLYNNRARLQFRALSNAPKLADGAEMIGLGRSIYAVFDRNLVAHALERVQQQMNRGVAQPSAQFVTSTASGQLLRARMAAVRAGPVVLPSPDGQPRADAIDSFVLLLDDITDEYERQSGRERLLHGLTEGSRGSLANLNTAVELLDDPGLQAGMRDRFIQVIRDEAQAMARRLDDVATRNAEGMATRWPLDEMLGADFVQAARLRIEAMLAGVRSAESTIDATLWLRLDSFSLMQALVHLASRLHDEFGIKLVQLRLQSADEQRAHLDLVWNGPSVSTETVMSWELDSMSGGGAAGPLTIRDVVTRHGGEFWFERDRARQQAFFRFLLPLAAAAQQQGVNALIRNESRPEYFDFDLFGSTGLGRELEDRPLTSLAYTVFDTETTGLDPSGGDEIIQIGATRVVNGKLLNSECFEQIIDPRRSIPEASSPIHGITPDRVVGQPTLDAVLPAFRAYADDTVLVAHNAAFDMRFLQLKEAQTGVVFDLPVLDTLLLSAVVHPNQASHRLEAIAERFGITVIGRHTALGDAMVTAEVLIKLIPLLADQGILTLGQARDAAQKTWFARLKY